MNRHLNINKKESEEKSKERYIMSPCYLDMSEEVSVCPQGPYRPSPPSPIDQHLNEILCREV
jgi:hypothetical protein